jgi:glycosyltransferase involved in cell wall biosynthesis
MRIIIYNPNSLGGNYKYARELHTAYIKRKEIEDCILVLPANADCEAKNNIKKILLADISKSNVKLIKKLYFFYRSLVNPIIFFYFLRKQPPAAVIFNDYDQLTALFWAPFYRLLRKRHLFATVLHDPDRDAYLPAKWLSELTMKAVIRIMDVAFYHEYLPEKVYYPSGLKRVKVPHGIYPPHEIDENFYNDLMRQKGDNFLIGILGNIRDEKNYSAIIEVLPQLSNIKLLVAGNVANSSVPLTAYKQRIKELNVSEQVIWKQKFLTEEELAASIKACDVIVLYYKSTFTSQSGILNIIAPFRKKIIVSDVPCALREVVSRFGMGKIVGFNDNALIASINSLTKTATETENNWNAYIDYASWDNHVDVVLTAFEQDVEVVKPV